MSYKVRFEDTSSKITVEHGETILEAAIRDGLYVNYGCGSGNCGLCAARLIEGAIRKTRCYDYIFTQAQKAEKYFLMCSHTADSDLTVRAAVSDSASQLETYQFQGKVRDVKMLDSKVTALVLQPPRSLRLRFIAGQYAKLSGNGASGEFSIASCPCDGRRLEFHIPRLTDNVFSRYVSEFCSFNDIVQVTAPFGEFVFTEDFSRPVALLAFDGGFAAIKSLFEHISAQESEVPISLYRISTWGEHYLNNLCRSWADGFDQLGYRTFELAAHDDGGLRACVDDIISELSVLEAVDVYCCAPSWVGKAFEAAWSGNEGRRVFWEPLRH